MTRPLVTGWAALLLALPGLAQAPQVRAIDAEKDIQVSCRVETLEGEVLFDWDGETPRVLASNTKLLTTAAALLALPANFRWQTTLLLDGERLDQRHERHLVMSPRCVPD